MKDPIPLFLRQAKSICLTEQEKLDTASRLGIRVSDGTSVRLPSMTPTSFFKKTKAINLSPTEKAQSREWLMARIEQKIQSRWWLHPLKHLTSVVAGVLIITISSGTLSYAAESAVPGEMLYPIKVNVNEVVRGTMKTTPEAQAMWEAEKAERRLLEAEVLTRRPAIRGDRHADIQARFLRHAEAVRTRMATLEPPMAKMIGQRFEATLRAHGNVFRKMNTAHPEKAQQMIGLLNDVQSERMKMEENLVARDIVADETNAPDAIDENITARKELRRRIEADLIATLPPSSDPTLIDSVPTTMMMKITPSEEVSDEDDEASEDMAFSIEARMNVTRRRLHDMKESIRTSNSSLPNDIETRMMGAEQIMDVAKSQMEDGNMNDALRASDMALRHAEKARKEGEERMRGN